jgi:hypothetical protein
LWPLRPATPEAQAYHGIGLDGEKPIEKILGDFMCGHTRCKASKTANPTISMARFIHRVLFINRVVEKSIFHDFRAALKICKNRAILANFCDFWAILWHFFGKIQ